MVIPKVYDRSREVPRLARVSAVPVGVMDVIGREAKAENLDSAGPDAAFDERLATLAPSRLYSH